MAFKHLWRQPTITAAKLYRKVFVNNRVHATLVLPAFSFPAPWLGASHVVGIFTIPITSGSFTARYVKTSASPSVTLAFKYVVGDVVTRLVFSKSPDSILPYPDYIGESLPAGTVLEVWNRQGFDPETHDDISIDLGILELPDSCCDSVGTIYTGIACIIDNEPTSVDALFENCGPEVSSTYTYTDFSSTTEDFSQTDLDFSLT